MPNPSNPTLRMIRTCLIALDGLLSYSAAHSSPVAPSTYEEQSRFAQTGRYEEVLKLCPAFAAAYPNAARDEFKGASETKEYMEDYVAEEVTRDMLKNNEELAPLFHPRFADNAAFAKDPSARLEFFARQHSSWGEPYLLYRILRSDIVPKSLRKSQ